MSARGTGPGRARAAVVLVAAASVGGCSAILGIQAERHVVVADAGGGPGETADAADDGGAAEGGADWSCIDQPAPPAASGPVELTLFMNDVTNAQTSTSFAGSPIVGATMRACSRLDFACSSPLAATTSDDGGIALITVPSGFDGYYEVSADTFTPTVLSRSPQFRSEAAQQGLANTQLLTLGAKLAGVTADPNLGVAIVTAADCASNPAPGVTFALGAPGPGETILYLENNLPSNSATQTDANGSAIIFNVPVATITLSGTIAATQRPIRTVTTFARKGWITFIQVRLDQSRFPTTIPK